MRERHRDLGIYLGTWYLRRHERDRGGNVGGFDYDGFRRFGQRAQVRKTVRLALIGFEALGEVGEDTARQRDIGALHGYVGDARKLLGDWKEGVRSKGRGFVSQSIHNLAIGREGSIRKS